MGAPLLEIYGCTESGQVASRRPVNGPAWQLLPGVQMATDAEGAWVFDGHVEGRVLLSDRIEEQDTEHFLLLGRNADMVNVAVPSMTAPGNRRFGMSAARNSACPMGAITNIATNRLTPP